MRHVIVMMLALIAMQAGAQTPAPYVNVYHDDKVAFQVRRDRIKDLGDGVYRVWVRWLWAEPQQWKDGMETARVMLAHVDCAQHRVRELAVLHKDKTGKYFDVEETAPEDAPWKSFDPNTGAAATIGRLCEFVPQLLKKR